VKIGKIRCGSKKKSKKISNSKKTITFAALFLEGKIVEICTYNK